MPDGVKFRHHCPPEVNPRHLESTDRENSAQRNPDYRDHIRREYEVPDDAWHPVMGGDAPAIRAGELEPTGSYSACVACPDCGAEVTVTTDG